VAYAAEIAELREAAITADSLASCLADDGGIEAVIGLVRLEIAKEAASLKFDGLQATTAGRDPATYVGRRIDALGKLVAIESAARRAGVGHSQLQAKHLERVQELFLQLVLSIAIDTVGDALANKLHGTLAEQLSVAPTF